MPLRGGKRWGCMLRAAQFRGRRSERNFSPSRSSRHRRSRRRTHPGRRLFSSVRSTLAGSHRQGARLRRVRHRRRLAQRRCARRGADSQAARPQDRLARASPMLGAGCTSQAMEEVRSGREPFVTLDVLHRRMLDQVRPRFGLEELDNKIADDLNLAWHRLDAWPDVAPGFARLSRKFVLAPCSNGNIALMVDVARRNNIPWDAILGSEIARDYKPKPRVYLAAAEALEPHTRRGDDGRGAQRRLAPSRIERPTHRACRTTGRRWTGHGRDRSARTRGCRRARFQRLRRQARRVAVGHPE